MTSFIFDPKVFLYFFYHAQVARDLPSALRKLSSAEEKENQAQVVQLLKRLVLIQVPQVRNMEGGGAKTPKSLKTTQKVTETLKPPKSTIRTFMPFE